jgi:hypothetical protein
LETPELSRLNLSQTAFRRVRQDIVEGRAPEKSALSEWVLAERLGLSRTTQRITISQLEKESVVGQLTNGAILVRTVAIELLIEIVSMRQQLESATAHLVAQGLIDAASYIATFSKEISDSMRVAFVLDWAEGAILSMVSGATCLLGLGMAFHLPATLRNCGTFTVGVSQKVIVTKAGAKLMSDFPRQIILK